jgi:hypothetical protein
MVVSRKNILTEVIEMVKKGDKECTVVGTIFPAKWDKNDNVVRVGIDTVDQDEYLIDQNAKGKELVKFTLREVEVTGTVWEDEYGDFVLTVDSYSLLGSNDKH